MRRLLRIVAGLGLLFVCWLLAVWPPPSWYRTHWPRRTAFMMMRGDGAIAYRPLPLDSIAPVMQEAAMTGEDARFRTHGGIDFLEMARAIGYKRQTLDWGNPRERAELLGLLRTVWSRRDQLRGASTITQQLAKNLYLSASRNPLRKVKEAVITKRLEWALGKDRIMELYLNVVELGPGIWGVPAASRAYFDREPGRLTAEQAAALAGTLPFPLSSNPAHRPGRMRWRQNLILRRMRGEEVEVPKVETEVTPIPEAPAEPPDVVAPEVPESVPLPPSLDSLMEPIPVTPEPIPSDSAVP